MSYTIRSLSATVSESHDNLARPTFDRVTHADHLSGAISSQNVYGYMY